MENKPRQGLSPNVILLSIVSFLNDLSSEMIMPILPMFLQSLGGGGEAVGLLAGFRDAVSNILKIFFGYWSDKTGRRKGFVYGGYFVSSIFKLLLALSQAWPSAVLFSGLERIGKGLRTAPRDAIIAESMTSERGKGFGIHRSLETAGAVLGTLVAFALFWYLQLSFRTIVLIAGIIGFAALAPIRFVSEPPGKPHKVPLKLGIAILPAPLMLFILVASVFAFGNFSYMFFVLKAGHLFPGRFSQAAPILLYALFNVVYSLLAAPLGILSDRIGREKVIAFGYLLFALAAIGAAFFNSLPALIVLFALYGGHKAAIDGTQRALVADLAHERLKATALGTFHTATGLAALPGGILAGFLWERYSPQVTFLCGAVLGLVSVLLFVGFGLYLKARRSREQGL
jgi:MFS family permease